MSASVKMKANTMMMASISAAAITRLAEGLSIAGAHAVPSPHAQALAAR